MTLRLRPLAELCLLTVETVDPKRLPEREFWYVDISAVDNRQKRITAPQRVKGKNASVRAKQLVRTNDVIVATTRPNLNAIAIVSPEYDGQVCSTGFCVLRPGDELDPDYLFCFARSRAFVDPLVDLTKGALYPAVTDRQVFAQLIPWTNLNNQRRLATQLKAQLAEVETARLAAQGQAQDIAVLRVRLLKEILATLKGVQCKVLGDHAPTTSGTTPPRGTKRYWEPAEIPWVKTGEVEFATITQTEEAVSRAALAECSLTLLPRKTVLVAMYGQGKTRGQSAILEVAATINQACLAILPNDTWEPQFLYYWLVASYQDLRDLSEDRGGNQANLNGALLKALKVPAPDSAQQLEVVRRIEAALHEIDALAVAGRSTLTELELLPQLLLAQAFQN